MAHNEAMTAMIGSSQAAEILGIARTTVVRRAANGQLKFVEKLPGKLGAYLFDRAEIEALARSSNNGP